MNSKIALIYIGGTFGCIGEPLAPMPDTLFFPQLKNILPPQFQIEYFSASNIKDSSACTAVDWLRLIQQIQNLQLKEFQHFIVIHGTDTMSYAAATLAHFLQNSARIIITGSQYPLLNIAGNTLREFSDAYTNLITSLENIQKVEAGVYLSFHDQIFHARTAIKMHSTELNAFSGQLLHEPLNQSFQEQWLVDEHHIKQIESLNIFNISLRPVEIPQFNQNLKLLTTQPPDILIIQAYGTGNLAVNQDSLELFKKLQQQQCRIILDSQVPFGQLDQRYAISSWLSNSGILINDTLSDADLYAKILKMYLQYPSADQWHLHWYDYS